MYRDRFTGAETVLAPRIESQLLEMTLANELEICQSSSAFMEEHRRSFIDLCDRFENSVSKKGFAEYRKIFGL